MDRHIRGIDHVLVGVRDLESAARGWQRLGFTTTPLGRHIGWSTANVCVMLQTGYIELLGMLSEDAVRHEIATFIAGGEGGMGLAFASDDPDATAEALRRAGLEAGEPERLARRLEAPEGEVELRFRNVVPPLPRNLGLAMFACHHETPELVRRPEWLEHANGARSLRSCTLLADDPGPVVAALDALLGDAARVGTDEVVTYHLGGQSLVVAPPEDAQLFHPQLGDIGNIPGPRLVAVTVAVADLARAAAALEAGGVAARRTGDGLAVPPEYANGISLEFVA